MGKDKENDEITYERLTADGCSHICADNGANESQQECVLAVKVEEHGPMHFTLLDASARPRIIEEWTCL